jgi:hypothetical protein
VLSETTMPRRASVLLVAIAVSLLVLPTLAVAAPNNVTENTYIEFIFDSSLSMRDRINNEASRMAIAKEVLREVIGSLEDQPGLQIALRVYGSKEIDELACRDSELFVSFGSVGEVRSDIIRIVESLEPRGRTPIGYSLQLAAKDFPMNPGDRNVIVLITDGQESCGIDPCQVSYELQEKGIIMKPYVVGFAMSAKEEASVRCIGEYYSANDRESLTEALRSILVKVIPPPSLQIEAYGGGQSVLDRAVIEITDSTGQVVFDQKGSGTMMTVTLEEGVYTVRGYLTVGLDTVTASQSNVQLVPGQTTTVRLDFGSLTGGLRVRARASGRDVSDRLQAEVLQSGRVVQTGWSGVPPTATLPVGEYLVRVAHRDYPTLSGQQVVRISPDRITVVDFDLGELPAQLEVSVLVMGRDITSQCELTVSRRGAVIGQLGTGNSLLSYTGSPGPVDLNLTYAGDVRVDKIVTGTVLNGGETTRVTIDLSDMLGVIRATVLAGDADVTASSRVNLDGYPATLDLPQRGAYKEAIVPAGFYGAKAFGQGGYESSTAEIDVFAGQVTTVVLELNMPGTIVLRPTAGGKALPTDRVTASVLSRGRVVGQFEVIRDRLTAVVDPGTYDLVCTYPSVPEQTLTITGVSVDSGRTKEVAVDFAATGVLEVSVIAGDRPLDQATVTLYQGDQMLASLPSTGRPGRYQIEVVAGEYDLDVVPQISGFESERVDAVQVPAGERVQKQIVLSAATVIRVTAFMNDQPTSDVNLYLYKAGQTGDRILMREKVADRGTSNEGVFESQVEAGTYDLLVSPNVAGFRDRWINGLTVAKGETLERRVQIGGTGKVQIAVLVNGERVSEPSLSLHSADDASRWDWVRYNHDRRVYELEVAEGVWDLQIRPNIVGMADRWIEGLEVWGGETLRHEVSLGGRGKIEIAVLVNGERVSEPGLSLHSADDSSRWDWVRYNYDRKVYELEVAEGVWDLQIRPNIVGMADRWIEGLEVRGGETLRQEVSLGGRGKVEVTVLVNGQPVSEPSLSLHSADDTSNWDWVRYDYGRKVYELEVAEGVWDLQVRPNMEGMSDKWIEGLEVRGGEVLKREVVLSDRGTIRVRVLVNGEPTSVPALRLYRSGTTSNYVRLEYNSRSKAYEIDVPEGVWDLQIVPYLDGVSERWIQDLEVRGGETLEREVRLADMGTIRMKVLVNGQPASQPTLRLYRAGTTRDYMYLQYDNSRKAYEISVSEGVWDLQIVPNLDGVEEQWIKGLEVLGGETLEREVRLADMGTIRIKVLVNGDTVSQPTLRLYRAGTTRDYMYVQYNSSRKAYEINVSEGVWDLQILPNLNGVEDQWITGLEVRGGETLEREVRLADMGTIRMKVLVNGEPVSQPTLRIYRTGTTRDYMYVQYNSSRKAYEINIAAGVWDIQILPNLSGVDDQWIEGLQVRGGETLEREVRLADMGTIRIQVLVDGEPVSRPTLRVYRAGTTQDYMYAQYNSSRKAYEINIAAGEWDVMVIPNMSNLPDRWIYGLKVSGGGLTEQTVSY